MKSKGLIVIIIILLLGLCGSVGYIVYDKVMVGEKVIQKEVKEKKQNKEEVSIKKLTEKDTETYMRKIENLNKYFSKNYPIDDVSNLSNDVVLNMGRILVTGSIYTSGGSGIVSFVGDKVREEVVSYFGSDYPLKLQDINCFVGDGVIFQYDATTDMYKRVGNHGHGGEGSGRSKAFFQDGTYNKDTETYIINVKIVSSDGGTELVGPRVDFYDAFNFDTKIYNTQEDTEFDVVYKEISDKLSIVTYTFVKNSDGGYGLKSVTM